MPRGALGAGIGPLPARGAGATGSCEAAAASSGRAAPIAGRGAGISGPVPPASLRRATGYAGGATAFDGEDDTAGGNDAGNDDDDAGPNTEDPFGTDDSGPPANVAGKAPKAAGSNAIPGWENTEGLPKVTVVSSNGAYIAKDIADKPGESSFRPTLGCKCGLWEAAPSHPTIEFRKAFLTDHPDFQRRVRKLQVRMEDTTTPKTTVHWDAVYDLKRFLAPGKEPKLVETLPAIPHSGTQLNFLTFCPPEGGPAHRYRLTVTALDDQDSPINYFTNEKSTYQAAPPPEVKVQLPAWAKQNAAPVQGGLEVARARPQLS